MKPIVYVRVCWRQVGAGKIEPNRNAFSLDRRTVHDFELIEILSLSDGILARAHNFLPYYGQLHVLDLDSYQVEVDFS